MNKHTRGISPDVFKDTINDALHIYEARTGGRVQFDPKTASELTETPEKSTWARSSSPVKHAGEVVSMLTVIAFATGDATGDANTYQADELDLRNFLARPKYFPRSKMAVHSEVHLTIGAFNWDKAKTPLLFAGHLSILGLRDYGNQTPVVEEIGYVGQDAYSFANTLEKDRGVGPRATLTTGHADERLKPAVRGERFGDPHAIVNRIEHSAQVCAFLAIPPQMAKDHFEIIDLLGATVPRFEI